MDITFKYGGKDWLVQGVTFDRQKIVTPDGCVHRVLLICSLPTQAVVELISHTPKDAPANAIPAYEL